MSGGGAVCHDEGNLSFGFMPDYQPDRLHDFDRFTRPLLGGLSTDAFLALLYETG
jgi:lipoate-protein ligase A